MSLKERLVDGDVLESDDPLLFLDLDDPVHQQERVAVRQNLHDLFYRVHPLLLSSGFDQPPPQRHRAAMARLDRYDPRAHPRACQRQITDTIHRLVTNELVLPAKLAAQNIVVTQYDRVI